MMLAQRTQTILQDEEQGRCTCAHPKRGKAEEGRGKAVEAKRYIRIEEHGLLIETVKNFGTAPREALFAVLRRFGLPGHFVKAVMRLHFGANHKVEIGEGDSKVDKTSGVR
jgi:hypothetical protein